MRRTRNAFLCSRRGWKGRYRRRRESKHRIRRRREIWCQCRYRCCRQWVRDLADIGRRSCRSPRGENTESEPFAMPWCCSLPPPIASSGSSRTPLPCRSATKTAVSLSPLRISLKLQTLSLPWFVALSTQSFIPKNPIKNPKKEIENYYSSPKLEDICLRIWNGRRMKWANMHANEQFYINGENCAIHRSRERRVYHENIDEDAERLLAFFLSWIFWEIKC